MHSLLFKGLNLIDSFLFDIMNAVRFKATDWTFEGPFYAGSEKK